MIKKRKPLMLGAKSIYHNIIAKMFENSKQFVCFNTNKEPLNPINLKRVDITNNDNLTSIKEALFSANKHNLGIGIVLGKSIKGNICGIDIDNCIDKNGNISKEAKEIIDLFNSYTEISISGKGIHILFYATKKGNNCKNNNLKWCKCLEMYDRNRYFTLSGNIINAKSIEHRQEQCDFIYKKYFDDWNKPINSSGIPPIKPLPAEKLEDYEKHFQFALSVDEKLLNYWNGERPTNDESANDNGFINKLAYWLPNYYLIENYFLKSPYFEQKDQKHKDKCLLRKDYLHRTILKALRR